MICQIHGKSTYSTLGIANCVRRPRASPTFGVDPEIVCLKVLMSHVPLPKQDCFLDSMQRARCDIPAKGFEESLERHVATKSGREHKSVVKELAAWLRDVFLQEAPLWDRVSKSHIRILSTGMC